ncbi:MAG: hypothetical protein HRU41_24640 [Saprospiraceae bacterium]|nr:hypothetical protein [Saprospiraceae bacterium]
MDKPRQDIESEIERTLSTLDEVERVSGNPFLYTRIQEQMRQSKTGSSSKRAAAWSLAFAVLLLLVNISSVLMYYQKSVQADQAAGIEAIASEYGLLDQEEDWEY